MCCAVAAAVYAQAHYDYLYDLYKQHEERIENLGQRMVVAFITLQIILILNGTLHLAHC